MTAAEALALLFSHATCKVTPDAVGLRKIELAHSELAAALERARVVAVLDGWRQRGIMRSWRMTEGISTSAPICRLSSDTNPNGTDYCGGNEDAARAAAARAIEANEV